MEEAPENSKESLHSAHANGMNELQFQNNMWLHQVTMKNVVTGHASISYSNTYLFSNSL